MAYFPQWIMIEVVIILFFGAVFVITYKAYQIDNARKRQEANGYINLHRVKMKNDRLYAEYLDWCQKNGQEIPIDKHSFVDDIERKENQYNDLIK